MRRLYNGIPQHTERVESLLVGFDDQNMGGFPPAVRALNYVGTVDFKTVDLALTRLKS